MCISGFEQAFLQGFDHKNVSAGFAKRKVNIRAVLCPIGAVVTNEWCIHVTLGWSSQNQICLLVTRQNDDHSPGL